MTRIDRPHPGELLTAAFELINARGEDYDNASDMAQNFREIAAVSTIITGKELNARDVAMILACVKMIRSKSAPDLLDNYIDGVNYMAFAASFAGLVPLPVPGKVRPTADIKKSDVISKLPVVEPFTPTPVAEGEFKR